MRGEQLFLEVADTRASQILEFALAVPLLVVFVVGIYDFGQAFNTKQKLNFAARDGARFGSALPTNDLSQSIPVSVAAIRDLVDADLLAAGINDCGLSTIQQTATLVWTATGTCQNTAVFTLTIDRGFVSPPLGQPGILVPGATESMRLIATRVSISYPFQWHFNNVIQLIVPGTSYAGITQIPTDALVPNQD